MPVVKADVDAALMSPDLLTAVLSALSAVDPRQPVTGLPRVHIRRCPGNGPRKPRPVINIFMASIGVKEKQGAGWLRDGGFMHRGRKVTHNTPVDCVASGDATADGIPLGAVGAHENLRVLVIRPYRVGPVRMTAVRTWWSQNVGIVIER